jgi:transketolase
MDTKNQTIEQLAINTVRILSADAVQKANSGHPGMPMGAAPMAHVIYADQMKYNAKSPKWVNRDRFILSAGHGCMMQYSLLYLTGYEDIDLDDITAKLPAIQNMVIWKELK